MGRRWCNNTDMATPCTHRRHLHHRGWHQLGNLGWPSWPTFSPVAAHRRWNQAAATDAGGWNFYAFPISLHLNPCEIVHGQSNLTADRSFQKPDDVRCLLQRKKLSRSCRKHYLSIQVYNPDQKAYLALLADREVESVTWYLQQHPAQTILGQWQGERWKYNWTKTCTNRCKQPALRKLCKPHSRRESTQNWYFL